LLEKKEELELNVVKVAVTAVMVAPAGIDDRSYLAQPLLPDEDKLTRFPSLFVPPEVTDPELNEPVVPVQVIVTVVCARPMAALKSSSKVIAQIVLSALAFVALWFFINISLLKLHLRITLSKAQISFTFVSMVREFG